MPVLAISVIAAVCGAIIGSFLNVVAWRVPRGESIVRPPSACPKCGHRIAWYDNIPVFSWLALRGRCRNCHAPISARYPIVEGLTGLAFAAVTWLAIGTRALPLDALHAAALLPALLAFAACGIVLTIIDVEHQLLPNGVVATLTVLTVLGLVNASAIAGDWSALLYAGIGMAALFAFYLVIVIIAPRGMGGGDVKLAAPVGALLGWVGWSTLIVGAFAAFAVGAVVGVTLMATSGATRKSRIPFGPFMLIGAWIGLLAGQPVGQWYLHLTGLA
ncbi:MAG: prepilin peptidase [Pseudoclavibacter sp.]